MILNRQVCLGDAITKSLHNRSWHGHGMGARAVVTCNGRRPNGWRRTASAAGARALRGMARGATYIMYRSS
jgi:hypothetical protein